MRPLIWFRSDLRTHDNTALHAACSVKGEGVIALFVISPGEWLAHDVAPARIDLILRTLGELSNSLAAINVPLIVTHATRPADVPGAVFKVAQDHNCDTLFFNKEYEYDESRRDAATVALFEKHNFKSQSFTDQVCIEPGTLRTGEGRFYTVFTPFKKSWIKNIQERGGISTLPAPKPQAKTQISPSCVPASIPGFSSNIPATLWPAGEVHSQRQLKSFIKSRIANYKAARDTPSTSGTSALSPYLAIGALSPRQCISAAIAANDSSKSPLDSGSEGITTWISELIWREFYVHILAGFPRVCMHRAFQPLTEKIKWNDNPGHLLAWQQGRTGVPIVDAGMRQLLSTGWMHNRVRMIVAMYFSKNLFLDWRLGEKFFMRHLVDGFLASNNGGWQWSASVGTDAAPYFRIFNPVTQSERFDPSGNYIRTHVPELASLAAENIHAPWLLPPLALARLDYPKPLVDLSSTRAAAIQRFKDSLYER